ncbi:hypothetical protein BASA83_002992 [Batrachochytrium salamandrivorans]|nr:hypothetical protein BASA83_002992 [Batrachochytrium salamandrivorans]
MPANTQEGVPPTPFARALLRVCGQVFASATIPRAWLCASIVSIDKKDGDPLNPGDKQGIALINVGLKLVCKRRQNAGINTHVLFIDIRKAFDTVPVGALLWKLQNMGFSSSYSCLSQGTVHIIICSSTGRITVIRPISSTERGQTGMSIVWTTVQSSSSTTFSMVSHPSQSLDYRRDTNPIRGLMYADDVAVFADSEQSLSI